MQSDQFIMIAGSEGEGIHLINRDHIVRVSFKNGLVLHLSDGNTVTILQKGAADLFTYLAKGMVNIDGSSPEEILQELKKRL